MRSLFCLIALALCFGGAAAQEESAPPMMWAADATGKDCYAAFRGTFHLPVDAEVEIRTLGSSWFVVWLDNGRLTEGPLRFERQHPEYESLKVRLGAGRHVIAAQAHHIGETTRMLVDMPPFFYCRVLGGGRDVPVSWKCAKLPGYRPAVRRINPQLGWIEWCDTRKNPEGWREEGFDDSSWKAPVAAKPPIGEPAPATIAPVKRFRHSLRAVASGFLAPTFGYDFDDVPARFFLRDLACRELPAQGVWRRYDLGRVRLGAPRFVIELPAGAIVEFAYAESLTRGRVSPYITLSAGPSCNLDHYEARGGRQTFQPLTPKGGRFLEVHVLADPDKVKFHSEKYFERAYHDAPEGSFSCGDPLLEKIWMTGIETYRACTEDALIDNPTRERGQWTGDVVSAGMDIASAGYSDLRLCRRSLVQSALCARGDGLVAGLCPGGAAYPASYAAQWTDACLHYRELTGDAKLLEEMYPYAVRNIAAFEKYVTADGLTEGPEWIFIDWGYARNPGPAGMAYNLHFASALRAMTRWAALLKKNEDRRKFDALRAQIEGAVRKWLAAQEGWEKVGYHASVLALKLGFVEEKDEAACVEHIKKHILDCFPNDPGAPRLGAPEMANPRLITPYFAHYAFPPLIERGEMDFVLDQYRTCWGWALEEGRTTWVEVFDTRWTHCHQWAGCPTWQLSRYVLGLHPRFDLGENHFELKLRPGSLAKASGKVPFSGGVVTVSWERGDDGIAYRLETRSTLWLHIGDEEIKVDSLFDRTLHD